jgi:hypothetical protein
MWAPPRETPKIQKYSYIETHLKKQVTLEISLQDDLSEFLILLLLSEPIFDHAHIPSRLHGIR